MTLITWCRPVSQGLSKPVILVCTALVSTLSLPLLAADSTSEAQTAPLRSDADRCATVKNNRARLACFDALYATQAQPAVSPSVSEAPDARDVQTVPDVQAITQERIDPSEKIRSEPLAPAPAPVTTASPAAQPSVAQAPRAQAPAPQTPAAQKNEGSGAILERRARVNFSSKVKSLRAKDKQRMVFLLENGEVWMQSSPRNLPIKTGDEVTIKSGLMGGYILRTGKGVSSRVNRIK